MNSFEKLQSEEELYEKIMQRVVDSVDVDMILEYDKTYGKRIFELNELNEDEKEDISLIYGDVFNMINETVLMVVEDLGVDVCNWYYDSEIIEVIKRVIDEAHN